MPFDSNGNFTRTQNWTSDFENGIEIVCDRHDDEDDNFANGFNECMLRDGRAPATGNLKMGNFRITGLANAQTSNDAVTKGQVDSEISSSKIVMTEILNKLWQVGDIKSSVRGENHDNWFLCDGQAVSRSTYAELFAIIGTKFGIGDGSTTFNLPDYRGKFLRGLGGNSASDIYTTQAEGLPNITGDSGGLAGTLAYQGVETGSGALNTKKSVSKMAATSNSVETIAITFDASKSNALYGASEHVTPINQAVNYFIKVKLEN
jgi:microcystin-dependent protein